LGREAYDVLKEKGKKEIFNKYIERKYDKNGKEVKKEITVSNTYPVFLKLTEDIDSKRDIPYSIRAKNSHERFSDYFFKVTYNLIEYNKELYQELKDDKTKHKVLYRFKDSALEQVIHNGFKLLFLKSDDDLILLNYINENRSYKPLSRYIIAEFKKYRECHRNTIYIDGKKYLAINTYDAFMSFARINGEVPKRDLNTPFYECFSKSVENEYIEDGVTSRYCDEYNSLIGYTNKRFHYYIIFDKIIINRYEIIDENEDKKIEDEEYFLDLDSYFTSECVFCGRPVYDGDIVCSDCANNID
jgi:hypothetical protein